MRRSKQIRWILFAALADRLVVSMAFSQGVPRPTGDIFGFVRDVSGQPIAGAVVSYAQGYAVAKPLVPASGGAISQQDGAFFFHNLAPGSYTICAQVSGT